MKTVALDDIRILDTCRSESERFCDFESGDMCGYTTYGDFKWKLEKGVNLNTNPQILDHSTNTRFGSFVYAAGVSSPSKSTTVS